jgi:hypothetical protein
MSPITVTTITSIVSKLLPTNQSSFVPDAVESSTYSSNDTVVMS